MDFIQITNDPDFAAFAVGCGVTRIMVDLEQHGKQERQGGLGTFISDHVPQDVARVRQAVPKAALIVRINPLHEASANEIDQAIASGASHLMLPMFRSADAVAQFVALVAGRAQTIALLETRDALQSLPQWAELEGLDEIYVGLNDLHRELGLRFMFQPLADGVVDHVAAVAQQQGKRFGFGGIARLDEGLLPGRVVLGEHLRLGSTSVILSRTFNRERIEAPDSDWKAIYAAEIHRLHHAVQVLAQREPAEIENDRLLAIDLITRVAQSLGQP
ncbi:aldolase/citrate lyase family protein [Thiomonas arsenitoxydans]|uniref:aldolase/citrate lyase family protein n=1 Tax=Thiomonas arsenitoxydans (strain DSM 22701 / CIP 110005 / 3As) TaxID=426114 RepID=UPI001AD27FE5|nr:aldolase/citrate lyase family protein [Thiomonas arsenitoxydans]MBN8777162.1 aldolase [Thiomonas arsenitoxydans]